MFLVSIFVGSVDLVIGFMPPNNYQSNRGGHFRSNIEILYSIMSKHSGEMVLNSHGKAEDFGSPEKWKETMIY